MVCSTKTSSSKRYATEGSSNINLLPKYALKAVAAGVLLTLSSGAYAACDYTASDDFDNDGIINVNDDAPCDIDLQKVTINHIVNGDFEAGANYWTVTAADASYTSIPNSFNGSNAIEVTTTKNNKGLNSPEMTANGFGSLTLNFWTKAININDHTAPIKVKLILRAKDGSVNGKGAPTTDKFLAPVFIDNTPDPDMTDDIIIHNAAEWLPISVTFNIADLQAEAQSAIDAGGETAGTLLELDSDGKYSGSIKLQIQPAKSGDIILVDSMSLYGDTDKDAMQLNAITDTDGDGLMDDMDPHPSQAYLTETKPTDDFDGDGVINSEDVFAYNPTTHSDSNNDGYADNQTAPLTYALSHEELEFADAEGDNWSSAKFVSSKDSIIGETSYKVDNTATSKSNIITISPTQSVSFGFWAKTDATGANAGDVLKVQAKLLGAKADGGDLYVTKTVVNTDLSTDWQYFEVTKVLDGTENVGDTEINIIKPVTPNEANIWVDGIVIFVDADSDALKATDRDTDTDGINDFWDNDDDNDGLLDGEDITPLVAVGSFDAPDIDQDGTADVADVNADGILDYFQDVTAPVISLKGPQVTTLVVGGTYTDLGATALDETDGDITSSIITAGTVDTATPGVYTLTYNISDKAGNAAVEVTRTVTVLEKTSDTTIPVISLLGDENITISEGDTYNDAGATASDDTDGDITANIVITGSVDPLTAGIYTLTYSVSDAGGNPAELVSRVITVVALVKDTTAPVITLLEDKNLTIIEGETYSEPGATATDETDGNLTANIIVTGSVDTTTVGSYTVTYSVSDSAGNTASDERTINVISNDTVAPVFPDTLPDLTFDKATPDAVLVLADLTSAPVAIDAKDGEITATTTFKDTVYQPGESYVITWVATDAAGNSSEVTQNLTVTAPEKVIEKVDSKGGSFSFTGIFLIIGLFARRFFKLTKA